MDFASTPLPGINNEWSPIKRFQKDNGSISFYTGFPNYDSLMVCFEFVANKAQVQFPGAAR